MKITRLILKNFEAIKSAMNKQELDLDISNLNNLITVIIGKMGSGKTTILGHLQPFATYGTIDIRNQDDQIIKGKDGLKQLFILNDTIEYIITHKYIANKDKHTIKSYITKDGEELNPNGNQSSFKTIIELEFNIDQSYLVLMRLGSNVMNLINMSSTERKRYIANLLTEVEFYSLLNKTLREDHRQINAHLDVLGNRLSNLNHHKYDELDTTIQKKTKKYLSIIGERNEFLEKFYSYNAEIDLLLNGMKKSEYYISMNDLKNVLEDLEKTISEKSNEIKELDSKYDLINITKSIGGLESTILTLKENIINLDNQYNEYKTKLSKYEDDLKIINDDDQLSILKESYDKTITMIEEYKSEIVDFECNQNSLSIKNLILDLELFSSQISDLLVYNRDNIEKLFNSDSTILQYGKEMIDKLTGKKINLQRSVNNIKFLVNYQPEGLMYLPPLCPTMDHDLRENTCPYYRTHPINQPDKTEKENLKKIKEIQDKIDQTDVEIYKYSDYPVIYSRLTKLKLSWKDIKTKLDNLGILKQSNLLKIIKNPENSFYNHKSLMNILELCEKREKYYELTEKIQGMKAELNMYSKYDLESLIEKINSLKVLIENTRTSITTKEETLKENENELERLRSIYLKITEIENLKKDFSDMKDRYNTLNEKYSTMLKNIKSIETCDSEINKLNQVINDLDIQISQYDKEIRELEAIKKDIESTTKEYKEIAQKEIYLKYMIEASSSKNGLPLIFVKRFISSTKDIVNDMLYEVFNGNIEIIDFDITETDFSIPYYTNGTRVDDVIKASQGEQSIISIAISFALMQKFMKKWNIPLLDEVDGPLYKSDRSKFLSILFKHIKTINAEQAFIISHNNTFDGYPVNVIMTTNEVIDSSKLVTSITI